MFKASLASLYSIFIVPHIFKSVILNHRASNGENQNKRICLGCKINPHHTNVKVLIAAIIVFVANISSVSMI